jgi:hypothetical protein
MSVAALRADRVLRRDPSLEAFAHGRLRLAIVGDHVRTVHDPDRGLEPGWIVALVVSRIGGPDAGLLSGPGLFDRLVAGLGQIARREALAREAQQRGIVVDAVAGLPVMLCEQWTDRRVVREIAEAPQQVAAGL